MARNGTEPANSEAGVRIGTILALPSILRNLGANPAEILAEAGFDLAQFDDPDNRISYAARNHLIAHCAARTGCRHLGLLIGQQIGLQSLGLVGLLVKYSPDVGTALRNLVQFHASSCPRCSDEAGNGRRLGDSALRNLSTRCRGHRSYRGWCGRRHVQHPARAVRPRLEGDRGPLCPPQAGRCPAVPQLLPRPPRLRRRAERGGVRCRLVESSFARNRSRTASPAAEGRSTRSRPGTATIFRGRSGACCARRS